MAQVLRVNGDRQVLWDIGVPRVSPGHLRHMERKVQRAHCYPAQRDLRGMWVHRAQLDSQGQLENKDLQVRLGFKAPMCQRVPQVTQERLGIRDCEEQLGYLNQLVQPDLPDLRDSLVQQAIRVVPGLLE